MSTPQGLRTRKRILRICVRLFLEKGYKKTTMAEIVEKAEVSYSSFQNLFRAKDGVLTELVQFMYSNQFDTAEKIANGKLSPVYVYAVETAIQLALTELNENLREIYTEAYTQKEASEYIYHETAAILQRTFGRYLPDLTEQEFYEMEVGSGSIMRGYMAHHCNDGFPLEKKIRFFLSMTMRAFKVPEEEIAEVIAFIGGLDIRAIAMQVMQKLFEMLAMHYEFSAEGLLDYSKA